MKKIILSLSSFLLIVVLFSCTKKEENPPAEELLNTHTFTIQNQLNANANCFFDCQNAVAYNKTEAAAKQSDIDFILWQYTGTSANKDSYLRSPLEIHTDATGAGQQLAIDLGIDTWTTWKNATSSNSDVTEVEFDAMSTKTQLVKFFTQNTHGLVNYTPLSYTTGVLLGKILIFQDKNGKRGFIKVKSLTSGTTGAMTIEVKMEK